MSKSYVRCIDYSIYKLDENLKIIEVDENFEIITGYSKKDIKENNIGSIIFSVGEVTDTIFS